MPNRMLRDCTDSEAVNSLEWAAEVLFYRLIQKADDYGRFTANPKLIRSFCFPIKDGVRETDIARWLAACEEAGLLRLYEADDKPLLEIRKFGQRLKQSRPKYPGPDVNFPDENLPGSSGLNGREAEYEAETELQGGVVYEFPVVGSSKQWPLARSKVVEWIEAYPGIDVERECRKALQWLRDNPRKQKTARGMPRFLNSWMERAQNDGRNRQASGRSTEQSRFQNSLDVLAEFAAGEPDGFCEGNGPSLRLEENN